MNSPNYGPRKGIFRPKVLSTLKPGLETHIGKKFYFRYAWTIDEEDGGPYVGKIAYTANLTREYAAAEITRLDFGWLPEEDIEWLEDLEDLKEEFDL